MAACVIESHLIFHYLSLNWTCINCSSDWVPLISLHHQTKKTFTVFSTFLDPGDRRFPVHFSLFLISLLLSFPFVYVFCFLKAQAEERAAVLRAQLEERKKAILRRINQEGKGKLEKVIILPSYCISCHFLCSFGRFLLF